jgi:hypothetical protein
MDQTVPIRWRAKAMPGDRPTREAAVSGFDWSGTAGHPADVPLHVLEGTRMSTAVRVVARFNNGTVLKGTTQDFYPSRPHFHLLPADGGTPAQIRCAELKALFFVKTFEGDPKRVKRRGFIEASPEVAQGRKVVVRFKDGEFLCGYTLSYAPDRDGFFVVPVDTEGNSVRIYVVAASTAEVKTGPAAEALAQRLLSAKV